MRYNGVTWTAYPSSYNNYIWAICGTNVAGRYFFGGNFQKITNSSLSANIAYWNGTAFEDLSTGMNGPVQTLAFSTALNRVYIGGSFSNGGSTMLNNVGAWNLDTKSFMAIYNAVAPSPIGADNFVQSLFYFSGKLYAGGGFAQFGNALTTGLGVYDEQTTFFQSLGIFNGTNGAIIESVAFDLNRNSLIVGGYNFQTVNGIRMIGKKYQIYFYFYFIFSLSFSSNFKSCTI